MMKILAAVVMGLALTGGAVMANVADDIRNRTQPVGELCVDGEDCGDVRTTASSGSSSGEPRGGEQVYADACQACHNSGAAGAPRLGNQGEWEARVEQETATLVDHAINGIGSMPAKGGCSSCSDEEIEKAVEYMLAELE